MVSQGNERSRSDGSSPLSQTQSSRQRHNHSSMRSQRSLSTPRLGSLSPTPHSVLPHVLAGLSQLRLNEDEIRQVSEEKKKKLYTDAESSWKETIRHQMEEDLAKRVRDALQTPPLEKMARKRRELMRARSDEHPEIERLNAQFVHELELEQGHVKKKNWKSWRANRLMRKMMAIKASQSRSDFDVIFKDELSRSNHATFPGVFGLDTMSEGMKDYTPCSLLDKSLRRQASTKAGFLEAIRQGRFLDGSVLHRRPDGTFVDKYGVVRTEDGPFWPLDCEPLFPTPRFKWDTKTPNEPYSNALRAVNQRTSDNQQTVYTGKWRGAVIVYDSERSPREQTLLSVPEDCCPSLRFESRFECGNLRQARRVGQFEYELVLKTDLHTNRHTQWYYFRVHNTVPGVVYKFKIINFLKKDSLYNHGMRPLMYSDKDALTKNTGWLRTGHHISYSRNVTCLHCPLLMKGINYFMLDWQMEFSNEDDTCYLAHCYPYTFTDLREEVDSVTRNPVFSKCVRKEVLCESRAGNSCFLLTVSDFSVKDDEKKGVIITGRVHPGESNASWMMKGVLEFITGNDSVAKELRKKFIFKIVPMLNPDGVIVGNYRCSLAARDLNRNYRHPRKDNFPTVWYTKNLIDKMAQEREIALYCDLHGHSRKHNVFMYGNNTGEEDQGISAAKSFLNERIFPWLMSNKAPEKFTFEGCKFSIRKCKESTGRVVMWRQMRVLNSFTLEATFSGTTINKTGTRHFNTTDFREMGESLVRVVADYQMLHEDPRLHAMVIQQLTRYITRQILQSKGFATGKFQALRQSLPRDPQSVERPTAVVETGDVMETEKDGSQVKIKTDSSVTKATIPATKVTESFLKIITDSLEAVPPGGQEKVTLVDKKLSKDLWNSDETINMSTDNDDVTELCDAITPETMDECLDFLDQLNVRSALQESDSSDSDSESEPEMKNPECKKKKKRKSKKQRDKDRQKRETSVKSEDLRPKTITMSKDVFRPELPPIPGLDADTKGTTPHLLRIDRMKMKEPLYTSKYEGRHNNGIPCFAEERSVERAAKRMAEVKKRKDDSDREPSYLLPDVAPYHNFVAMMRAGDLQKAMTQDDLRQRLNVALHAGTPNVAQTLVGLGVKPAFSQPEEMVQISNIQPLNGHHGNRQQQHRYSSSSEDSDGGFDPQVLFQTREQNHVREMSNHRNAPLTSPRRSTMPQVYASSSAGLGKYSRLAPGFKSKSPPASFPHHQPTTSISNNNNTTGFHQHFYKHLLSNRHTDRLQDKRIQAYRTGGTSLMEGITSTQECPDW